MADRAISALPTATTLTATDLFVLSQSNQAKNTTWQTIIGYLTTALDGHGGIQSISKTGTSDLVDTYTITMADQTTQTFTVTNGKSTSGITQYWAVSDSDTTVPSSWSTTRQTMTATNRYLWSYYTFAFNDGTTIDTTKAVVGVYGDTGQDWHVYIRWSENEPTRDADISTTPNNWIGIYSGTAATAPTSYSDYEWFEYKGDKGDTGNGITGILLYSSSGLVDTYRVYFDDGTYTSFDVTNGSQIDRIEKTATSGLTDTYTVYLTNGTSATTFNVTNGKGISSISEVDVTHAAGHTDVYRINFNDGDTYTFRIYNGSNGSGSVSTVDNIPSNNQDVPLLQFGQGAPTTATVGHLKSRYFDQTNSILYICVGIDTSGAETTYTWQGAGVTVDSALSTMSTNPVQNAVLTALLGTATLDTTAQTLTGAVNELNAALGTKANQSDLAKVVLRASVKTISANGTSSNTLTGLTANHVVGNWGMFSDAACTVPIPENAPTCDITITTAANSWNVTIANFSSTFYLRPTFILKQN